MNWELATDEEVSAARRLHTNDDIEIDDKAFVSRADDGVWVQAWVFVPNEELPGAEIRRIE